ncbi:MAG: bifunctional homocysteine S-methyltransferase/methylenetetrahydrofolate reductase [Gemmatimonadetes bacterium]|nr:bifunctional homocysteine S-methyltransferase/methylenetetrahydrofolate reductase [Gemmatimonadota bacterium]
MHDSFLDTLGRRPVLWDGAMGTMLYNRGIFLNQVFEELCLSRPKLIRQIHLEYLDAGAEVLETNTFGANRLRLRRSGIESKVNEINAAAVEIAQECSAGRAWVAGAIGPTGRVPSVSTDAELDELREAIEEQAVALAGAGADLIVLETFRLLSEMRIALKAVRETTSLPIVAQMAFDEDGKTGDGADPEKVVELLREWGADSVGCNCMEGPQLSFELAGRMVDRGLPISVQPNAGYPRKVDERLLYMVTPEYFTEYLRRCLKIGVAMVGGCCGTTPEHIRHASGATRMMGGGRILVSEKTSSPTEETTQEQSPLPLEERSALGAKIEQVFRTRVRGSEPGRIDPSSFCVSVEIGSPFGLDMEPAIAAARLLQASGCDAVNIADGPRATVRVSNSVLASVIEEQVGLATILHVCSRDRNLLRLQSDLLGGSVSGLHNLIIITGDPPKVGDYPNASAVYDVDSIGLLKLAAGLNRGVDPAGRGIGSRTSFVLRCGAEPAALDYDREIRRLEEKKKAGAEFVMTQPVYEAELIHRFLDDIESLDLPVMVGLLPLASFKNATFLHNEVPGMQIPEAILSRMEKVGRGRAARAEGIAVAQEALDAVKERVVGAYVMPPFGNYRAAVHVLEGVGYELP